MHNKSKKSTVQKRYWFLSLKQTLGSIVFPTLLSLNVTHYQNKLEKTANLNTLEHNAKNHFFTHLLTSLLSYDSRIYSLRPVTLRFNSRERAFLETKFIKPKHIWIMIFFQQNLMLIS